MENVHRIDALRRMPRAPGSYTQAFHEDVIVAA
jgi:hypothetical protein